MNSIGTYIIITLYITKIAENWRIRGERVLKYCYKNTRNRRGFTLVELMVVLAVSAVLAALVGGGLIAYVRLARFQKNESNARAMFQTAQLAVTQLEMAGEKERFAEQVGATGRNGHITQALNGDMTTEQTAALNTRIYALYFDKGTTPAEGSAEATLLNYIKDYVSDESFTDASFCIEIDGSTGQVFSAFYDSRAEALRFADNAGNTACTTLDDRSYTHRRSETLVGYYCAEDTVNVVNLQQTKLRVRNLHLTNSETLTLSWGGNSKSYETDTRYTVEIYKDGTEEKLFSVVVTKPTGTQATLPVTFYDEHGTETETVDCTFPISYSNSNFILTLDAMNDAAILQATTNEAEVAKSELFSITRFIPNATDICAKVTASPRADSVTPYSDSETEQSNTENSHFGKLSDNTATLQYFRHLYNLRWYKGETVLTAELAKDLDWLSGAPVVYCVDGPKAAAKTPSADSPVAWPSLLELKENVTLDGKSHTITGLQLRGASVAEKGCRYIGLVGENSGTIKNLTLADPDVLVNVTAERTANANTVAAGGLNLALLDKNDRDSDYRDHVRAVGALCGVSTGTVKNCTVKRSKNRTATARVAASLAFDDTTTTYTRTDTDADGKIDQEPLGVGGLIGSAVPAENATLKDLTADSSVTVAGLWVDNGTKAAADTDPEQAEHTRHMQVLPTASETGIDRAIGVGGVFGVLSLQQNCTVSTLNNAADVYGNVCTGGIAGNICGQSAEITTLNNLNNTGSVNALAGYQGYTQGQSLVLGQFFGGVAGMMQNAELHSSSSGARSGLSESDIRALILQGYNPDGSLNANSPLQGDFVGGLVGFGGHVTITGCRTRSGYVLGNTFVGGLVGGLSRETVWSDSSINNSHVFGHRYVGGVASVNSQDSEISNMTNTGMTAAFGKDAAYVGGIVGLNAGTLTDCTAAVSTNTATNASRVALLDAMANGSYANLVGGVAGYNMGTITWKQSAAVSVLLNGGSLVGGVVGFNDSGAVLTLQPGAALTVGGRIVAAGDAAGGLAGMNCAASLPAVTVKTELISGQYCVGGVVGANLPAADLAVSGLCTDGGGNSLQAKALAGGIIGYNRVIAAKPDEQNVCTRALSLLPTVTVNDDIATVTPGAGATKGTAAVTLSGSNNTVNVTADAYVGGVVGYNDKDTKLTVDNAQNGAANSVDKGILRSGGSLQATYTKGSVTVYGNMAGGIIGYAGASTTLQNCHNYAGVFHTSLVGGIAGFNVGTIQDSALHSNLGTVQSQYKGIGGIAGVNAGSIQNSLPQNAAVNGGQYVGGVAGINTGKVSGLNGSAAVRGMTEVGGAVGANYGTVEAVAALDATVTATGDYAGGLAGKNIGTGTLQTAAVSGSVQAANYAGGLAGHNAQNAKITDAETESALSVRASGQYAGGAAGQNEGTVKGGSYQGTVYAAADFAGGVAGENNGTIQDAAASATVTCENGQAGGVAAVNNQTISGGTVQNCTVKGGTANLGAVAAVNSKGGVIKGIALNSGITLQGGASVVGGVAGVNLGTIGGKDDADRCKVEGNALTLSLTAADITFGGAAGQNDKDAIINNVQVALNVTRNLEKYRTLGGVAGNNNGTLENCVFTAGQLGEAVKADAPATTGAAKVGDAFGGMAGVNNGKVEGCYVQSITLNVLGESNVEASQDVETKLNSSSHVGGLVGRNTETGTIKTSFIGTDGSTAANGSAVIAKFGFVGGVAGSNAGTIEGCGGHGTAEAVTQIETWIDGGDTDIDAMITQLKYTHDTPTSADNSFNDLRGVDTVKDGSYTDVYDAAKGLAKNQLLVALRGETTAGKRSAGYLGGITGFNTDTGSLSETATGKWFVYCDNGDVDNAAVGGMIGQNESDRNMSNLLNCAAVRRFYRIGTENDDDNANNLRLKPTQETAVGGVIGVQQNRTGDRWSLTNVVNYGTVYNSRSNRMAGVICLWLDNGGTLEKCFNFGTLYANANDGSSSGTAGGIVAKFDKPVAGGTTNIVRCQSQGDIWWVNNKKTANDVGGILGSINMKKADDYLIVNISECVVGDISMAANSQIAGMIGWIGPWEKGTIHNAHVNIDRCRNYCTTMETDKNPLHGQYDTGSGNKIGIAGNRGAGGATTAPTTITGCFVLYDGNNSKFAIAYNLVNENIKTYETDNSLTPNFYMDKDSFNATDGTTTRLNGLENLYEDKNFSTTVYASGNDPANTAYGYRVFAGVNKTTNKFFAAQVPATAPEDISTWSTNLKNITPKNSYIDTSTNLIKNKKTDDPQGKLLFTFTNKDKDTNPTLKDITDADVRAFYTQMDKDNSIANKDVTDIQVSRSDETTGATTVYGRYVVTWGAVPGASYYKVTVKVWDEDKKSYLPTDDLPAAAVYTNRYTFDGLEKYQGKKYKVEVQPCNTTQGKVTESVDEFTFAKTLPTPQIKLYTKENWVGFYLENLDDYNGVNEDWEIEVTISGSGRFNTTIKREKSDFTVTNSGKGWINQYSSDFRGLTPTFRASVKTKNKSEDWMQSARYNVESYIPQAQYKDLGNLSITNFAVTGTSTQDLAIDADLSITGQKYNPKYRIMLQGRCKDSSATSVSGQSLKDQFVTLQAVETVLSGSATHVTFTDLPDYALTEYYDWRIVAAPVNSGKGDSICRWRFRTVGDNTSEPIEYVRETDGDGKVVYTQYAFHSMKTEYVCCAEQSLNLTVLPAPVLGAADYTLDDNNLLYTFTWNNVADASGYTYKLYGVTATGAEQQIELPAGAAELTPDGTFGQKLTVKVDKLKNGASDWHYTTVRLYVTGKPADAGAVGATASKDYTDICTRLTQPGAPDSILLTDRDDAEALRYQITWAGIADSALNHYALTLEYKDGENWKFGEPLETQDTNAQLTADLEKYLGKTLRLRVVAMAAADGTVLPSPYSAYSNTFTVATRVASPAATAVQFADASPTQQTFLSGMEIRFTVGDTAPSHYVTGYLFQNETDYTAVAALADAWQSKTDPAEKAAALAALQTALKDNTKAVCLVTQESVRTTGLPAETTADGAGSKVSFTLTPELFTMQPQYGDWYLLPAVRTMADGETNASSLWTYYTANAVRVPCIKLDTPDATRVSYAFTGMARISDTTDFTTSAESEMSVKRIAVEWHADNLYTTADGKTNTLLANTYTVSVAPKDGGTPYTLRVTVQAADKYETDADGNTVMDADGNPVVETARGAVTKVEKSVDSGATYFEIPSENGSWDVSVTQETDTDGKLVLKPHPVTLTGKLLMADNSLRYYQMDAVPLLQYDAENRIYRLVLPDLAELVYGNDSVLQQFTNTVQVTAQGVNGFAPVQDSDPKVLTRDEAGT